MHFSVRLFTVVYLFLSPLLLHAGDPENIFPPEISREFLSFRGKAEKFELHRSPPQRFRYEKTGITGNRPWAAIAALPFMAGGVAAHFRTKALHKDYMLSVQSEEAGELRKEVKQMQVIRNVSFGAAGLLGIMGIFQITGQNQRHKRVRIEYLPFACSGTIGLTF